MAGSSSKIAQFFNTPLVIIVHAVDTEGPIGGNVRRRPDGTKEFMDNWSDIKVSLKDITSNEFRQRNADSFGNPFKLNWFIMDFIGFSTNPKNRITEFNDTYDNIKSLNTKLDSFHWHYHQPPISGIGDQWSDDWDNSDIHYDILGHRIIDRQDFPEVFRAGGTVEDNKCSRWLEDNFLIDYSNRASYRSEETSDIFDFNWFEAPRHWGAYHPHTDNFMNPGEMRRHIVRCVDLRSRLHELQQWEVDEAFSYAQAYNRPIILSYFSHDHRDMRDETRRASELISNAHQRFGVNFMWSDAKEALQISKGITPLHVRIGIEQTGDGSVMIHFHRSIYQRCPFVYTKMIDGSIIRHELQLEVHPACPYYLLRCFLKLTDEMTHIGVACTSTTGDASVKVLAIEDIP